MNYFTLLATNQYMDNHTAAIIFLCSAALVATHILSYAAGAENGDGDAPIMLPFVLVMFATIASTLGSLIIILANILN
jgi:ABC-type transport system involved in cytochrome bd biosynthesis fused ATPase/permease subunit